MNESSKTICPECELRKLQVQITKEKILQIVEKMEYQEGITTPQELYEDRLKKCDACPYLVSQIMCSQCGAYVALRAKNLSATCPCPGKSRWN